MKTEPIDSCNTSLIGNFPASFAVKWSVLVGIIAIGLLCDARVQAMDGTAFDWHSGSVVIRGQAETLPMDATPTETMPGDANETLVVVPEGNAVTMPQPLKLSMNMPAMWAPEATGYEQVCPISYPCIKCDMWPSPSKSSDCWGWRLLPEGMIYRSYLADMKEPGMRCTWVNDDRLGNIWDVALGGRTSLIRYGTSDPILPEGFEIDLEGAALLRLDQDHERDMMANDFRFGVPLTAGTKCWQYKLAYYHLSSHLGDEYKIRVPSETRINYVRDEIVLGIAYIHQQHLRLYAEAGWAFYTGEDTKPWEFQFGAEYSKLTPDSWCGSPFAAIGAHLREEVDYGGGLTTQAGWQWRGQQGNLFRVGVQYYNGMDDQYEFYNRYSSKFGAGIWYDF